MAKTVPAARQLLSEVLNAREGVEYQMDAEDGFGRSRSITFDPKTSAWLTPILEAARDKRIGGLAQDGKKDERRLTVTFVGDIRADQTDPFEIERVDEVLNGDDDTSA